MSTNKKISTWRERIGQPEDFPLHVPTDVERAMVDEIAELRASANAAPGAPADGAHWDLFPGYLIDHMEGDTISEEYVQSCVSSMLRDANYLRIAAERMATMKGGSA